MNWRNVVLIFRREVVDQLRDRRTLFMVAVLPLLLYPILGIGMVQMTVLFSEQPRTVVILGAADLPDPVLVKGNRFSEQWFHSSADADKLRVVTDRDDTSLETPHESTELAEADERILSSAKQIDERIAERLSLEHELVSARLTRQTDQIVALEKSLQQLNSRLTALFDRSGIQVLIRIPSGFARKLAERQQRLVERGPDSTVVFDYPRPVILQNSADEKSAIAYRRVGEVFRAWERAILKSQLERSHLPETLTEPVRPNQIDLAEQEQVSANVWAKMFPALLVIMTLTGAFYPAVDLCAGEKERGTMETLLICPATRTEIVLGKFLTVFVFSATTALLNLASVGFTGKYMASLAVGGAASKLGDLALPSATSLVWVIVILMPLATLFSALCLAMATFAKSSKEGQYYLTPLLMVTLGLTMFCLSPTTEMHPFYSVMPVVGPGLLLKGLLKANGPASEMYLYAIPVLVTSIGYSLLALWWAIEQFGSEEVLFREAERFDLQLWIRHLLRDKEPVPTFAEATFCFLIILLLQFISWKSFQTAIQNTAPDDRGTIQIRLLMIQQIALIATPALLMGVILTTSIRQTFSLRWPGYRRLACAALLPLTLHPLTTELLMNLQWFFPPAPAGLAELAKQLQGIDLWLVIVAFAVTPAICEEITFRGFLLAGFRRMGRVRIAIVLSSCAFGIIHMIPHQVFNATLLGLILGTMCVRNRSLLPGIAFHFTYNTLGILHDRLGKSVPVDRAWSYFFRFENDALRYQPALLCLLSLLCIGLLYCLLQPSSIVDPPEQPSETHLDGVGGQF